MKRFLSLALFAALAFLPCAPASADGVIYGVAKAACGTMTYTAGDKVPVIITAAGYTCVIGTVSPSGNAACTGKIAISQTSSTDLRTFTNVGYICSVVFISATAQNVSLVEGTGTVCASNKTALIGSTTASIAVAANGGMSSVSGTPWLVMGVSADHLCLLQDGSGNISGVITYADHA